MKDTSYHIRAKALSNAIDFDGAQDYISLGNPSFADFGSSDFALEAWIQLKDPNSRRQMIVAKDNDVGRQFELVYNGGNDSKRKIEISYFVKDNSYALINSNDTPIVDALWHHVLGQRVGNTLEIYLDGNLIKSGNGIPGAIQSTNTELRIGARQMPFSEDYFKGKLDEVRIWNRSFTAAEIKSNYKKCVSDTAYGLVAYYKFDEPKMPGFDSAVVNSVTKYPDGYIVTGTRVSGVANCFGCENMVPVNITVNTVDTKVTLNKYIITANDTTASYQWIDCNNNKTPISGANGKSYTATVNGSYAVIVTKNGCSDTSVCTTVGGIGIATANIEKYISLYPNPTTGEVNINFGQTYKQVSIKVRNLLGQEIYTKQIESSDRAQLYIPGELGIYMVEILTNTGEVANMKVVKN